MSHPQCLLNNVWQRYLDGVLGQEILKRSTPAVFYAEEQVLANMALYESAIEPSRVEFRYAVKACSLFPMLQTVARVGWGADCQSVMEGGLALRAGVKASKSSLCSPRLSLEDIGWAMTNGLPVIADSRSQLDMIGQLLKQRIKMPCEWHCGARVSLPVEGTVRFHSKLGMEIKSIVQALRDMPELLPHFGELHHHGAAREVGAELLTEIAVAEALAIRELEESFSFRVARINLGGGMEPDSLLQGYGGSTRSVLEAIFRGVENTSNSSRSERIFVFEPGRAIAKDAAIASTKVINMKELRGNNIAVVDVSTNLLIPLPLAQFGVHYPVCDHGVRKGDLTLYDIVDGTCSPAGVICRQAALPKLEEGQQLLISQVGAYTWSLAEPFYDWLPDLWWIDQGGTFHALITRSKAKQVVALIWGVE